MTRLIALGAVLLATLLVSAGNVRSVPMVPRTLVLPALAERPVAELHVASSLYSRGGQG